MLGPVIFPSCLCIFYVTQQLDERDPAALVEHVCLVPIVDYDVLWRVFLQDEGSFEAIPDCSHNLLVMWLAAVGLVDGTAELPVTNKHERLVVVLNRLPR